MKYFFFIILAVILTFGTCPAQVHVKGYYRKDGTYVQPHTRSNPDSNPYNNYSYPGNTNPYTGKVATGNPDTHLNKYRGTVTTGPRFYIDDKTILNSGEYMTLYSKEEKYTAYNIYSKEGVYNGYIVFYLDNKARLFDKDNQLVRQINDFKSTVAIANSNNNTNSRTRTVTSSENSRIYIKDKEGNYTDNYMILFYSDSWLKKYRIYNHSDDEIGTMSEFDTGEMFIYDNNDKLIKHVKRKK